MTEVRLEMDLAAPPEGIFDVLADHARYNRMRAISTSKLVRDGDEHNGVGAVRALSAGPIRFDEEITVFDRPRRLGYRIISTNLPIEHEGGLIRLEPAGAGTRVLWTSTFRSTVPLLGAPAGALLALSLKRGFRRMLEDADRLAVADPTSA